MIIDFVQCCFGFMVMDFYNKVIGYECCFIIYIVENFQVKYDIGVYMYLLQMVQVECMCVVYKVWRCDWGKFGERGCGGVFVWQFNDCWLIMFWVVVDYYLVKKLVYYVIKRVMKQIDVGVK